MGGSKHSAILTGTLSFDISIRGLVSGGILVSRTLLEGVRRATLGPGPGAGPLFTAGWKAVVPTSTPFPLYHIWHSGPRAGDLSLVLAHPDI